MQLFALLKIRRNDPVIYERRSPVSYYTPGDPYPVNHDIPDGPRPGAVPPAVCPAPGPQPFYPAPGAVPPPVDPAAGDTVTYTPAGQAPAADRPVPYAPQTGYPAGDGYYQPGYPGANEGYYQPGYPAGEQPPYPPEGYMPQDAYGQPGEPAQGYPGNGQAPEAPYTPAFSDNTADAPFTAQDYVKSRGNEDAPYSAGEYIGSRNETWGAFTADDSYDEEEEERRRKKERSIFKERQRKPSFILAVMVHSLRLLLLIILLTGLSGAGAVVGVARAYVDSAPVLDLAVLDHQAQTTVIKDANGDKICDYKGTENRIMVPISTMPMYLRYAFVAVEDARFYEHNGIDVKRIAGAFIANFTTGSNQGGSTITQQLIKNTLLSSEQSYKRKIQEAYLAMQLETKYSKDEILECYLNTIYLGEDYYGVKTASYGYFGKENLTDLTLRECAMLAGVTRNPSYYNPRRNFYTRRSETTDYAAITDARTDYVLLCMYENGFISYEEYQGALDRSTAHVLSASPEGNDLYKYPHYVEYAIRDVIQVLLKINGLENTAANRNRMDRELRTGGYVVWLAVDPEIQTALEDTLYGYDYPDLRDPSDKVYRARNADGTYTDIPQPQAAAVVMDYRTGEVKAIVGSRTRPTQRKTLNRATDMNMPVGSSIKPIGVYAPAIEGGQSPASVVYNMPLPLAGWKNDEGQDSWPKNYGGSEYRGPETMRTALTYSDNTAAAYALLNYSSVERSADFLKRLGVSDKHINATPFGLSLGSSGITPFEMAAAYSCLGNGGVYLTPITFLGLFKQDENSNWVTVWDSKLNQTQRRVFSASTAWLVIDMMKDAVAEGTGTPAKIKGQTVAGKTGTNSDQKGVFFVGLTGWYCGAVWVGHDNYKSLSSKATGGKTAGKLWQTFMTKIHTVKGLGNQDILPGTPESYGLVKVTTCAVSGQLATDACRHDAMGYRTVTDYWREGTQPTVYCQMHVEVPVCDETGRIASQNCPSSSTKGILILPYGHPLTRYQGTQYEGVLTDYLGDYASLRFTGDPYGDAAALAPLTCTRHTQSQGGSYDIPAPAASSQTVQNAQTLLSHAMTQLSYMDPSSPYYYELYAAVQNMQEVLNSSAADNQLYEAMSRLTQAMAAVE
ncbi:MAG: hypothetical protein CW338_01410 [Clostridiales bacterium]|nr:hypothetical protein [Clostridiales bacterium]